MSFAMHGVGVSGGIAIGNAHLISHAVLEVPLYILPLAQIPDEIDRFEAAIATTRLELEALRGGIPAGSPAEFGAFLDLHMLILSDHTLSKTPIELIKGQRFNAEWALKQQMDTLLAQFDQIEDDYLRERKADVVQVVERVLKALLGHSSHVPPPVSAEVRPHPGGARLKPGRHDAVQAAAIRCIYHRCRRRHFAHRDCRPQPEHSLDRGTAPRTPADPRERAADRGRSAGRGDRQPGQADPGRIQAAPEPVGNREAETQAPQVHCAPPPWTARRWNCTPISNCRRISRR